MKTRLAAIAVAALTQLAPAQEATAVEGAADAESAVEKWREEPTTVFQADEIDIEDFRYVANPVVVFADRPTDPDFQSQLDAFEADRYRLVARDIVLIADSDPEAASDLRQRLRPRGFMLVVMGKDLEVELRKPVPWDVREITRTIDKMP